MLKSFGALVRVKDRAQGGAAETVHVTVPQLLKHIVGDYRVVEFEHPAVFRTGHEDVTCWPQVLGQAHDHLFAQRVDRRICNLGEELGEVPVEELAVLREDRHRSVCAHRTNRLLAVEGHWRNDLVHLFQGVTEAPLLAPEFAVARQLSGGRSRQILKSDQVLPHPGCIGFCSCQVTLDFVIFLELAGFDIDQDHLAGGQAFLAQDLFGCDVKDARFRSVNDLIVTGDPVARRAQAVAIEDRGNLAAVTGDDVGRAVPWLHHGCVVFEEAFDFGPQVGFGGPGLGDQHRQRVGQAPAGDQQELKGIIETGRI